ncbi:TPA: GNAT family N-acetyltransferase, partial [Candidatus Poribacteria bacterium]|nr:GNAT family N-acetyltransferase [Candidatus Poribacteria bacterium]
AINKALKNGLTVECENHPQFINEYYKQLIEVFANKGLVPTYGLARVQTLFDCLNEQDLLFTLQVKYNSKIIATGLFPHDNHYVYYWGGASYSEFRNFYPNELIQWTLMKMAAKRGITKYHMGGGNNPFKTKWGGELIDTYHWYKSYNPLAKIARSTYQWQFRTFQKIRGLIRKYAR